MANNSKESLMRARLLNVLEVSALQFPSMSVTIELWRPKVVSPGEFADEAHEVWIRLDENVPAFCVDKMSRWFDAIVGVTEQKSTSIVMPGGHVLAVDDHVILRGEPWIVTGIEDIGGICTAKIDKQKSRFRTPGRNISIYREIGLKARIA